MCKIETYLRQLVDKFGYEERERQKDLRYCDGSKERYYEKCLYDLNNL